jgi:hypothetical protein
MATKLTLLPPLADTTNWSTTGTAVSNWNRSFEALSKGMLPEDADEANTIVVCGGAQSPFDRRGPASASSPVNPALPKPTGTLQAGSSTDIVRKPTKLPCPNPAALTLT